MNKNKIDFSELQEEVMQSWEKNCIEFVDRENVGFDNLESHVLPEYQEVLDNPILCILDLGFDSLAEYIASKSPNITYSKEPKRRLLIAKVKKITKFDVTQIKTYEDYLKYLKVNFIKAEPGVKYWAKKVLDGKK